MATFISAATLSIGTLVVVAFVLGSLFFRLDFVSEEGQLVYLALTFITTIALLIALRVRWPWIAATIAICLFALSSVVHLSKVAGPAGPMSEVDPRLPTFPWPPPQASARVILDPALVLSDGPHLADVADALVAGLADAGYPGWSFFSVPSGFALVAQMEQIAPDGVALDGRDRWVSGVLTGVRRFTLTDYFRALFLAPIGHFRIIVFVVTDIPFGSSDPTDRDKAEKWIAMGPPFLPTPFELVPFSKDHRIVALIYEFVKRRNTDPLLVLPGQISGEAHLKGAGVFVN